VAVKYRVKNWRTFQHYSDRNPPWIKLHFSMLSSEDWVTLDDASRVLAIACMLIASRNGGEVPGSTEYMKRVAYLNKTPNFKPLIECGFLEVASDCKQMLADARPETETETETETEGAKAPVVLAEGVDPKAWADWLAYRKSIGKPLKPASHAAAQRDMAKLGNGQSAAVEHSKAKGWTGLFAPTGTPLAKPLALKDGVLPGICGGAV
jgi:hypothetical protein